MIVLADSFDADAGLIPGFSILNPLCGLPLAVMAGVIERPFYTAAGIQKYAVWYSIQANFLSLMCGYVLLIGWLALFGLIGAGSGWSAILLWPFLSIAASIITERAYLNLGSGREYKKLGWMWAGSANLVSALAAVLVAIPLHLLDKPDLKRTLLPYQMPLGIFLTLFCLTTVILAFLVPRVAKRQLKRKRREVAGASAGNGI